MKFPCPSTPNKCGNPPTANLTSEASDGPTFVGFSSGIGADPFLGDPFNNPNGFAYCESRLSQADADLCATNNAIIGQVDNADNQDGGNWRTPTGNPVPIYTNQQTAFTAFCADGSPFVFTVPAGRYKGLSQIDADRTAQSFAKVEAELNKVCLGSFTGFGCLNAAFSKTLTVQGRGSFTFSIWAGALPPGIALSVSGPNTALFTGVPNTPGNFTFTVQAVNSLGYFMRKQYTIEVLGITTNNPLPAFTPNTAYSLQFTAAGGSGSYAFTLISGTLPAGMALSNSGLLSGTPTTSVDATFTIGVSSSDFSSNTCTSTFTLPANASAPGPDWSTLVWSDTLGPFSGGSCLGGSYGTVVRSYSGDHFSISVSTPGDCDFFSYPGPQPGVEFHGVLHYTGPACNCKLVINCTGLVNVPVFAEIVVDQDGTLLVNNNEPNALGSQTFNFSLLAGTNSLITVTIGRLQDASEGLPNSAAFTGVLSNVP